MATKRPDLQRLARGIQRCRACRLHESRRHAVPGEGPRAARVMLVGEAPGEKEDDEGRPFIGRSGKFLSQILTELGLARDQMFITSAVKCRPPKNRTPRPDELDICRDRWLDSQIDAIQPRVIVLLGGTPVRQLLDETTKLNELHGRVIKKDGRTYLITYHPAAAMRFPRIAAAMRKDLKKVRRLLGNSA